MPKTRKVDPLKGPKAARIWRGQIVDVLVDHLGLPTDGTMLYARRCEHCRGWYFSTRQVRYCSGPCRRRATYVVPAPGQKEDPPTRGRG